MTNDTKTILYPELQAMLGHLHLASPRRVIRPLFETREEAEALVETIIAQGHEDIRIRPVWEIDYSDLSASKIRGWSIDGSQS